MENWIDRYKICKKGIKKSRIYREKIENGVKEDKRVLINWNYI